MKFLLPLACTLLLAGCSDSTTTETAPANNEPQSVSAPSSSEMNQTNDAPAAEAAAPVETPLPQEAVVAPSAAKIQPAASAPVAKAPASIDAGTLFGQKCASCHGVKGEKSALGKSQIIANLSETQIKDALYGYQAGTYGKEMKALMQGQAKGLSTPQIDALAKYVSAF